MITCLETNISTHFIYINYLFKDPKSQQIKFEIDKEKIKLMYKELNKEIRNLKFDFHNQILDSKEEYHNWINTNKKFLYPDEITKSIAYDVKIPPEIYLIHSFLY